MGIRLIYLAIINRSEITKPYFLFIITYCSLELLKFQYAVFNLGIVVRQRTHIIVLFATLLSILIYKKKYIKKFINLRNFNLEKLNE